MSSQYLIGTTCFMALHFTMKYVEAKECLHVESDKVASNKCILWNKASSFFLWIFNFFFMQLSSQLAFSKLAVKIMEGLWQFCHLTCQSIWSWNALLFPPSLLGLCVLLENNCSWKIVPCNRSLYVNRTLVYR